MTNTEIVILTVVARTLRTMTHPKRIEILNFLEKSKNKGGYNVTQLYQKFKIKQAVMSHHLAQLRNAGIVETERNGKQIFYTLNREMWKNIQEVVNIMS